MLRPTPAELLDSAQYSLKDIVIPAVADEWALYVAKCMEKVLATVRLRIEADLHAQVLDTAETAQIVASLSREFESAQGAEVLRGLLAPVRQVMSPAESIDLQARIAEANVESRRSLVNVIEALFELQDRAEDPQLAQRARGAHARLREFLDRQLARDVELMSGVFMAFGAPPSAPAGASSR